MRKKDTRKKPPSIVILSERTLKAAAGGLDVTDGTSTEEARVKYSNITLKRG